MASLSAHTISRVDFNNILARYQDAVPAKLHDLDKLRFESIPEKVAQRKKEFDGFLEKEEVESLVEWKLKHGTFRPKLLSLVSSNPASDLRGTTGYAFGHCHGNPSNPVEAAKILVKLKGIGPATASLLLSVYKPDAVAFFSDELFRWVHWEEVKGKGWDRKIGYTMKEYQSLCKEVEKVRARLDVPAVEMEKVAWVLGREGADLAGTEPGKAEKKASADEDKEEEEKEGKKAQAKKPAKGSKRKAEESKQASEPVRRSKRRSGASEEQASPPDPEPLSKRTKKADLAPKATEAAKEKPKAAKATKEKPKAPPPKASGSASKGKKSPPSESSSDSSSTEDDPVQRCLNKGPNGSPTYDSLGYELDYHAIAAATRRPRARSGKKYMEMLERERNEDDRKTELMGMNRNEVSAFSMTAWDDRVSRDLGIPYHKVKMEHFEEWYEKGFRAQPGEFNAKNITPEDEKRINKLAVGSAFRK